MEVTYAVGEEFNPGEPRVRGATHLRELFAKAGLSITSLVVTRVKDGTWLDSPKLTAEFECAHLRGDGRCGNYAHRLCFCRSYPDDPTVEIPAACGFRWRVSTAEEKPKPLASPAGRE